MTRDPRRITLVTSNPALSHLEWDVTNDCPTRIIFVKSPGILEYALRNAMAEIQRDVERVVIDRAGTASQFLELLSRLPLEYPGDLLHIGLDGTAYLSSRVRGDGRALYALSAIDAEFYLATNGLVAGRATGNRQLATGANAALLCA